MNTSIYISIIYVLSFVTLSSGVLFIQKSETTISLPKWLPLSVIICMGYQAFIAGLYSVLNINVTIITMFISNSITGAILWLLIIKHSHIQKFSVNKWNLIIIASIIFVIIQNTIKRYGTNLSLSYISTCGGNHFANALNLIHVKKMWSMYYAALHNALLFEVSNPFISLRQIPSIYTISETMHLILAGLMFYGIIEEKCNTKYTRIASLIGTILYVMGYPLNSSIFGFAYQGMGITVIASIIALCDEIYSQKVQTALSTIFLLFLTYSIMVSYTLFVPVVFLAIGIWLLYMQSKNNQLFSIQTLTQGLCIFLIPSTMGTYLVYHGMYTMNNYSEGTTIAKQINIEGFMYKDLFTSFLFLIPIFIIGYQLLKKQDKFDISILLIKLEFLYALGMFLLSLLNIVSSYYFYKNHYLMWLFVFVIVMKGLPHYDKSERRIIGYYILTLIFTLLIMLTNIDDNIPSKTGTTSANDDAGPFGSVQLSHILGVYGFNYFYGDAGRVDSKYLEMAYYAKEVILASNPSAHFAAIGDEGNLGYFNGLTSSWTVTLNDTEIADIINTKSVDYIYVYTSVENYYSLEKESIKLLNSQEKVYETDYGFIIKIK